MKIIAACVIKGCSGIKLIKISLPNNNWPAPLLVMVVTPLNILFPLLLSLVEPVLVAFTVPVKVHPLKYKEGLVEVRLPPIIDVGPNVSEAFRLKINS